MTEPCSQAGNIGALQTDVKRLREYEDKQNGSLQRMEVKMECMALDIARLTSNFNTLVQQSEEAAEMMRWNRRMMYGTVITVIAAIAARYVGAV